MLGHVLPQTSAKRFLEQEIHERIMHMGELEFDQYVGELKKKNQH